MVQHPGSPREQFDSLMRLYKDRKLDDALEKGESLVGLFPTEPVILNLVGAICIELGLTGKAIEYYNRALQAKPDFAEAHNNLGNALNDIGQSVQAIRSFKKALTINPDFAEAYCNLGETFSRLGRARDAAASFIKALDIRPNLAEAHHNLGLALRSLGQIREALQCFANALKLNASFAAAHSNYGAAVNDLGNRDEAISSIRRALEIDPELAEAHRFLSTLTTYSDGDPQLHQMLQLIQKNDLGDRDRAQLCFALGKAFDDIGDPERAFSFFREGNRLRDAELGYDPSATETAFARHRQSFDGTLPSVETSRGDNDEFPVPVFVVGMPRSGTTLVEQILASHSAVHGGGEHNLLDDAILAAGANETDIAADRLRKVRESYLAGIAVHGPSAEYVTDKMPLNFLWIGYIAASMPEAKIVNVTRDARATCWSIYRHYFADRRSGFTNNLQNITAYYRQYVDLMSFWNRRYPDRIYDLSYETLTEHQRDETVKLLNYVGLDWQEDCLTFHENERAVETASVTQVRRPMYQGSSDDWRRYETFVAPMVDALDGL